ncbi:DivIVA domain-containing protein [Dactylosporangium sucinum]|uniref:Uncharacterized protein n=1 Tax=Dactylosporangium sucinum TaxID=1424081 RepID=A0A917TYT4_9ACTN|nr:DivIVA domain-containing protein [Dactylosporangium sucinum]GGM44674.1 hypothetical protein GCM10007977_052860 [Dactylosporangium sucinum]
MELHRRRAGRLVLGVAILVVGVLGLGLLAASAQAGDTLYIVLFGLAAALYLGAGVAVLRWARAPFRCHIGAEGLTLRDGGADRLVPWSEVEAVVIDQRPPSRQEQTEPQLSLVLRDRPDPVVLLHLLDVREPRAAIAAALRAHAGDRFQDRLAMLQEHIAGLRFDTVSRGYDPQQVDALLAEAQRMVDVVLRVPRLMARRFLEDADLRTTEPGYDPGQVDAAFRALAPRLARTAREE